MVFLTSETCKGDGFEINEEYKGEIKNNKNVDHNFEEEWGGSEVKKNLTIVFYDPENLYGHNRLSLSIMAEFRT